MLEFVSGLIARVIVHNRLGLEHQLNGFALRPIVTDFGKLIAMEIAGLGRTALYAGSWSAWCKLKFDLQPTSGSH